MNQLFSDRILNSKKSFIREILKITNNKDIISFAGGLPNPISFPTAALQDAMNTVTSKNGSHVFQYATTEGYLPLREYIAKRYQTKHGLTINADDILITSGSQQGLDLIGKVFLNKDDHVLIEKPGYLGAIQALSLYEPHFHQVDLFEDGIDLNQFKTLLHQHNIKLFYSVPNFQNPTGITYSKANREALGGMLNDTQTVLIEDDPYGELRFIGEDVPYIQSFSSNPSILLGSFSKIVTPGMRIGWICTTRPEIMDKLIIAKQASDLHTNYFSQRVIYQYLIDNNLEEHISHIKKLYKEQREAMLLSIAEYFPENIKITKPEGGMFLWATLPDSMSSLKLFELASTLKVAFVPGEPFYVGEIPQNTLRLNYTNSDPKTIDEGIKRLGQAIKTLLAQA
ncbi:aminotransferase-like domain-containing protein [Cellulosilyticum sp. I15G10I2]|uniref:aminotransferase-like domain-containing protein n=1 Tax=Cellulosilyticum sp. I15G10I2 TaxID=1892843 RepID=UPI00085BC72E|nr:PLP-dependent aminotransferase family protein [Cellulosilyticum sp. I15G10I2]